MSVPIRLQSVEVADEVYYLNPTGYSFFVKRPTGGSLVYLPGLAQPLAVQETPEEIVQRLEGGMGVTE